MSETQLQKLDPLPRRALLPETPGANSGRELQTSHLPAGPVSILIAWSGNASALETLGVAVSSLADGIATGTVAAAALPALAADPRVAHIETTHAPRQTPDRSPLFGAELARRPPRLTGRGVIVGIVDTGIDLWHPAFRRGDGSSAVLQLWDQNLRAAMTEAPPAGFGYGVEYGADQLRIELRSQAAGSAVRHRDHDGHGTYAACIAAGGAAPYTGIAPAAALIVVATAGDAAAPGNAARTLDAVRYIFAAASALGRPCVINLSPGSHPSHHDGTSLLDRGIDALLAQPGRALVRAVGNPATWACHGCSAARPGVAAPHITGAIALMLQAEPKLSAAAISGRMRAATPGSLSEIASPALGLVAAGSAAQCWHGAETP